MNTALFAGITDIKDSVIDSKKTAMMPAFFSTFRGCMFETMIKATRVYLVR